MKHQAKRKEKYPQSNVDKLHQFTVMSFEITGYLFIHLFLINTKFSNKIALKNCFDGILARFNKLIEDILSFE